MRSAFIRYYWKSKRLLLKKLVPEIVWPVQVVLDGVSFKVRNMPYSTGTKYLLARGKYEKPERRLLAGFIKPGDQVIEMGGSIGVLTAIIANRIGSTGRLISIEAAESLVAHSGPWLEKNNNTKVICGFAFPVADCAEKIRILSFDESAGALAGIVSFKTLTAVNPAPAAPQNAAPVFDLNRIVSQFGIAPNILVVDIEGSERIILDEAATFLASIEYVFIELHPAHYGMQTKKDIVSKIQQLGYTIEDVEENTYLFRKAAVHEG